MTNLRRGPKLAHTKTRPETFKPKRSSSDFFWAQSWVLDFWRTTSWPWTILKPFFYATEAIFGVKWSESRQRSSSSGLAGLAVSTQPRPGKDDEAAEQIFRKLKTANFRRPRRRIIKNVQKFRIGQGRPWMQKFKNFQENWSAKARKAAVENNRGLFEKVSKATYSNSSLFKWWRSCFSWWVDLNFGLASSSKTFQLLAEWAERADLAAVEEKSLVCPILHSCVAAAASLPALSRSRMLSVQQLSKGGKISIY